ncbi:MULTISPECIES: aldose 1-epimerase family protein [unclassified Bradyrhizobium]|uniref:aldose 1-epimerase family protein n=1 Tax=unclassified Bradyrhizobium TaxID=2631580 RepID=UPI0028EC5ED7|nr:MULTISPECIES: aldose 1-epimerase family protein [unclassified Bradyrhizobium]
MTDDIQTISAGGLTASIKADGAELCSLKTPEGLELLWQAGPAWPRHAPWLFPIVGRLKGDELHHRGRTYPMTQHGFARDLRFAWREREASSCSLLLTDSETTRARYPFAFRLAVSYRIEAASLDIAVTIENPGAEVLPASFGAHPAFNWPLSSEAPKDSYRLIFAQDELAPIRRLAGGLTRVAPEPSPVQGRVLPLREALFAEDAVILDRVGSRSLRYAGDREPAIGIAWEGFRELGIWSKPSGAPFLCVEPWRGCASPVDFDGEFVDKPGLMHIAPGAAESLRLRIALCSAI